MPTVKKLFGLSADLQYSILDLESHKTPLEMCHSECLLVIY